MGIYTARFVQNRYPNFFIGTVEKQEGLVKCLGDSICYCPAISNNY